MVNPILIIAITLATAFFIGILQVYNKVWARVFFFLVLIFDFVASGVNFYGFLSRKLTHPIMVKIGGFPPPIGINLYVGQAEAAIGFLVFFIALLGAFHWARRGIPEPQGKAMVLFLLLALGAVGITFTGDFFNLFVFIEITSIAAYGLVASARTEKSLEAAFKYMVIGSISSTFVLLSVVFLYKATGSLNMLDIASKIRTNPVSTVLPLIVLMFLMGILIELEVFPINGWALDVYQGADPVVVALLAGAAVKAFYLIYIKAGNYLALPSFFQLSLVFGGGTYILSQFFAWRQKDVRRLFGYSSVAQLGLLILSAGFLFNPGVSSSAKHLIGAAIVLFILNHSFAKSSLFFLADNVEERELDGWKGVLNRNPLFKFIFSTSVFSISGVPPFPGFWAKLLLVLAIPRQYFWIVVLILAGAVAEIVYYFRLYRIASEGEARETGQNLAAPLAASLVLIGGGAAAWSMFAAEMGVLFNSTLLLLLGLSVAVYFLGFSRILQWIASLVVAGYGIYRLLPAMKADLHGFFLAFVLIGGAILLFATYPGSKRAPWSFYPAYLVVLFSLAGIALSHSWINLFIYWELMSWASFVLINMGYKAKKASWIYAIFSSAGAYAMLAGIFLLPDVAFHGVKTAGLLVSVLLFMGFLVKMATAPLHIWARDAYGEAPDEFTPLLSGVMSKIGVFGSAIVVLYVLMNVAQGASFRYLLGWLGALTAFFMTLLAVFQEDLKKLLAYSSVGQVGYILIGIALATPLGWNAALYHTVNHFIFKGLLFVAAAGIIYRVGTSYLPNMGGLIRRMPLTFLAVLMAIISLAGIPPLSGFAGKWLIYSALIEKQWIFITVMVFLASTLAFLYCFKILHTVFLGQLQDENRNVKEVPLPVAVVEVILLMGTAILGAFPRLILDPINRVLAGIPGMENPGFHYEKTLGVVSRLGHWNALFLMVFTMGSFILALGFFALTSGRVRKVGQLDVGYSGEVPRSPEDLHFGYGLYEHFRKAVRWLIYPLVTKMWTGIYAWIEAVTEVARRIYTGSVNTYASYVILISILILYFFAGVK